MSVLSRIGDFFKSVGSHIKGAFIVLCGSEVGARLALAAIAFAKTELGELAITVVQGLEAAAMAGADKRVEAFKAIVAGLAQQGRALPDAAIYFAIEFALQIIRGEAQ